MNQQDALVFLHKNNPMPRRPDAVFLEVFREVLDTLIAQPLEDAIPYLINSFGNWPDFTIYEKVQEALRRFTPSVICPHLNKGLLSKSESVRSWCAHTLKYFPDPDFLPILERMLSERNLLVRLAAAIGLESMPGEKVVLIAKDALKSEKDIDVKEILASIINARQRSFQSPGV